MFCLKHFFLKCIIKDELKINDPLDPPSVIDNFFLLAILEKYYINKTCRLFFEKIFVREDFLSTLKKRIIENKPAFVGTQGKAYSS